MSDPITIVVNDRTILVWPCEKQKHQAYVEQGYLVLTCKDCKWERA